MLIEEAQWLRTQLDSLDPGDVFPMCNIGSSTDHFRRVEQPYIDKYLFEPARARGLKVVHIDMKAAPGVDLVGDLLNPEFLRNLAGLKFKSVMCCNLLEHVTDRRVVCDAIRSLIGPSGYLFVTVPHLFPYHEDPIDTMYRPTIDDVIALFPGTSIHKAAIVRASRFTSEMGSSYRALFWMIVRSAIPFYRPHRWWAAVRRLAEIAIGYKVTCVILHRRPATDSPK